VGTLVIAKDLKDSYQLVKKNSEELAYRKRRSQGEEKREGGERIGSAVRAKIVELQLN